MTDESYQDIIQEGLQEDSRSKFQQQERTYEAEQEKKIASSTPKLIMGVLAVLTATSSYLFFSGMWGSADFGEEGPTPHAIRMELEKPIYGALEGVEEVPAGLKALLAVIEDTTTRMSHGGEALPAQPLRSKVKQFMDQESSQGEKL